MQDEDVESAPRVDDDAHSDDDDDDYDEELLAALENAREEARLAVAVLARCSEAGLSWVRVLLGYMLCVTMAVIPLSGLYEWILVSSRGGSLEHDWWKCLCYETAELHYINAAQPQQLPSVMCAMLVQSCLLAWISIILFQRSCIRMDWISSIVVNIGLSLVLTLLPPLSPGFPAPTSISSAMVPLFFFVHPTMFASVPSPNRCGRAYSFVMLTVATFAATLLCTVAAFVLVCRAEFKRRGVVQAERLLLQLEPRRRKHLTFLKPRLRCCRAAPRTVVVGLLVVVSYLVVAVSRCSISVLSQRSFDRLTRKRRDRFFGGSTYIARVPGLAIGATTAISSFASVLRGLAAQDLANFRIATLLATTALFADVPAFSATVHAYIENDLYKFWAAGKCQDYLLEKAPDLFGFPGPSRSKHICTALYFNLYGTGLHIAALFLMTVAAVRTFTINDQPFESAVMPLPRDFDEEQEAHILRTSDDYAFEFDMSRAPRAYSALVIRDDHPTVFTPRRHRRNEHDDERPLRSRSSCSSRRRPEAQRRRDDDSDSERQRAPSRPGTPAPPQDD